MSNKRTCISFWLNRDSQMVELNQDVFKKDSTTDVISFPIDEQMKDNTQYLGEIVVDQDEVQRNADHFGHRYEHELARVVAHGVLHLLGYEDDTEEKRAAMNAIEEKVIEEFEEGRE